MSLTTLTTVLIVIFVCFLVSLFITKLLLIQWRSHFFRRQTPLPTVTTPQGDYLADNSLAVSSSKEQLLYFFCLRTQSRISSSADQPTRAANGSQPDDQVIDVFKLLGGMHGPSRVLCTIKEEEREGVESDDSAKKSKRVCLQACFQVGGEAAVQEVVGMTVEETDDDDDDDVVVETTPFSTPCPSPLYFTPAASPSHDFVESSTNVSVLEP